MSFEIFSKWQQSRLCRFIHKLPSRYYVYLPLCVFILQTYLTRINYHYEASASNRRHDGHGIYRFLLSGARWSGLDISTAHSGLLLAAETLEAAKWRSKNAARKGTSSCLLFRLSRDFVDFFSQSIDEFIYIYVLWTAPLIVKVN